MIPNGKGREEAELDSKISHFKLFFFHNTYTHTHTHTHTHKLNRRYMHLHDPFLDVAAPFLHIKYAKFVPLSRSTDEMNEEHFLRGTETKMSPPSHKRKQAETPEDGKHPDTHLFEPNSSTLVSLEFLSPECLSEVKLNSDYVLPAADSSSELCFIWYGSRDLPQLDFAVSDLTWLADQCVTVIAHAKQRDDGSDAISPVSNSDAEGWGGKSGGVVAACRIGLCDLFDPESGSPKLTTTRLSKPMYFHGRLIGHLETAVQCKGLVLSYTEAQDFARERLNEIRSARSFLGATDLEHGKKRLQRQGSLSQKTPSLLSTGHEDSIGHLREQMLLRNPSSMHNVLLGVGIADQQPVLLAVQVVKARNIAGSQNQHKLNPYVKMQVGTEKRRTGALRNSVDPHWDEVFVFGISGGLRHLAEQNSMKLNVLLRVKSQGFGSDDDIGSAVLIIDVAGKLDETSNMEEAWLSIEEPVPDSDSDDESYAGDSHKDRRHGKGGEIFVVYTLVSVSQEEDPEECAVRLSEQVNDSVKLLDSSDDEAGGYAETQLLTSKASNAETACVPETTAQKKESKITAEFSQVNGSASRPSGAPENTVVASAPLMYDPGAKFWWYVASDEARSVMGGYTGLEMAGWLAGGYFTEDLVVFYQGVPRAGWAKLREMYPDNMSRAFLEAPKKGSSGVDTEGSEDKAATLTVQQEIIQDANFEDITPNSDNTTSKLFSGYTDDSKFWIITDPKKQPVRMTTVEMREGLKHGVLTETMHTVPVGQQEWKPLYSFY